MGDDEEAARKAFEQFMVGGGTQTASSGKKKKKKSRNDNQTPTKSPSQKKKPPRGQGEQQQSSVSRRLQDAKNAERRYWRIYHTFCDIVKNDWIDIDDHLEDVVASIANIRGRLPMETRLLESVSEKDNNEWAGHGYIAHDRGDALRVEDIELAMGHDLSQHEKMLAGLRTLISNLSDCQDSLGRQVDEMMLHHIDSASLCQEASAADGEAVPSAATPVAVLVDEMIDIFSMLALELFRKQSLCQALLDSVTNDMLKGGYESEGYHPGGIDEGETSSRKVAYRCSRDWPRRSRHSCIDIKVLNTALRRCEKSNR